MGIITSLYDIKEHIVHPYSTSFYGGFQQVITLLLFKIDYVLRI